MNWKRKFLSPLIPLFIGFVTLEIGVRVIQFVKVFKNSDAFAQYAQIYSDERDRPYLFWHKPNVDWMLSDGNYQFRFITNNLGHRSLSNIDNPEESMVFIGDSIIEGASVENNETIPFVVGNELHIQTVNLGLGSSNTVQQFLLAVEKVLPDFNPRIIVLGFCLNDIEQNLYRRFFDPEMGNWRYYDSVFVSEDLSSHYFSELIDSQVLPRTNEGGVSQADAMRYVREILKSSEALTLIYRLLRAGLNIRGKERIYTPEAWRNTEYFIRRISDFAKERGSDFVVIIFPYQDQVEGRFNFHEQESLKTILERNEISYFDPTEILIQKSKTSNDASNLYHDNIHPNKMGAKVIAESFSHYLHSRGALSSPPR